MTMDEAINTLELNRPLVATKELNEAVDIAIQQYRRVDEFVKKLIERLEEEHERCINRYGVLGGNLPAMEVKQCMEIINQLAEEYGR